MNLQIQMLDVAPIGAGIGLFVGIAFFFVIAAVAVVTFLMLKKTVKMAFRMAIVGVILLIAIAGGIAFFALGIASSGSSPRPTPTRPKNVQTK